MKLPLVILLGCAASSLAQVQPYDRLGRDNVSMRLEASTGRIGTTGDRGMNKVVEVSISPVGANAAPVIVEFFVIIKTDGFVPFARLADKKLAEFGAAGRITFEAGKWGAANVKGWVVRAVRDDRVVGYVASAPEYERFATDSFLLAEWVAQRAAVRK